MKTILKLSILFLTIASVACKKDPPKEPDPPVATIPGFSIGDDGWIESPMWLADIVEHYDGWGVSVYIFKYEGEDCIHIINYASSYAFSGDRFFSLTGEDLINASYPATKEDYELLFAMKRAVKDAVFIWSEPNDNESAFTRAEGEEISVRTPNGQPVGNAWIYEELTQAEKDSSFVRLGRFWPEVKIEPNAYGTILPHPYSPNSPGDPTDRYNCHGYTWHMTEGGLPSPVAIYIPIDIYWNDGSFVKLNGFEPGAKVRYYGWEDDVRKYETIHSAVAETADIFVSKWGRWPLIRHSRTYGPYYEDADEITYYKRNTPLVITGPDSPSMNTNVTYSVPTAQNITFNRWEITGGGYTTTSGLNSRNLTIKFTSAATTYTLKAIFNLPNNYGTYTATKTVTSATPAPPPAPTIAASTTTARAGSIVTFNVTSTVEPQDIYHWEINGIPYPTQDDGTFMSVIAGSSNGPILFGLQPGVNQNLRVRCRLLRHQGVYSAWSRAVSVTVLD